MGLEAAGEISFEVSSPGAERLVQVPDELTRFGQLPLKVGLCWELGAQELKRGGSGAATA